MTGRPCSPLARRSQRMAITLALISSLVPAMLLGSTDPAPPSESSTEGMVEEGTSGNTLPAANAVSALAGEFALPADPLTQLELDLDGRFSGVPVVEDVDSQLLGVELGGKERGTTQAFSLEDSFAIRLVDFARYANVDLQLGDGFITVTTPLGSVELTPDDLRSYDNRLYLPPSTIREKLVSNLRFVRQNYALELDVPWSLEEADLPIPEDFPVDAEPPRAALSTLSLHGSTAHVEGEATSSSVTAELAGRFARGWWSSRLQSDDRGDYRIDDWAWVREVGERGRTLLGHQRINIHSLLSSMEMSGVQAAYTNQPLELFERSRQPKQLLSRRVQPRSIVQGLGPPAGLAELRVDGRIVARQIIRLDGSYEFFDQFLPSRDLREVEVYLYERNNLAVPVEIIDETRASSEYLMPDGAFLHQAGFGLSGNLADRDERQGREAVGFYQWRHGLSERFTLEAGLQNNRDSRQAMAGFVSALPAGFVLSAGVGTSDGGEMGYDATLDRYGRRFYMRGSMSFEEPGYRDPSSTELTRHALDLTYIFPRVQLGLSGRYEDVIDRRTEYLLPTVAWVPNGRFSLRAHPDRFGDYRVDAAYRYRRASRIALSYQDRLGIDLTHRLGRLSYLSLGSQIGDDTRPDRHYASMTWSADGRLRPTFTVGATAADEQVGLRASTVARLGPGLLAELAINDGIDIAAENDFLGRGTTVTGTITADLALAGNRLLPIHSGLIRPDRGGIAGRVYSTLGRPRRNLRNLVVFLDGNPAARTNEDGEFFIGNLPEGIFRIELGEDNLPIELSWEGRALYARVAAAAVTRIDFSVSPEVGFSGRVTDVDNIPMAGVRIDVLNEDNYLLESALTDQFGLYRFDGLPPGRYELRLAPTFADRYGLPKTSRWIELEDEFLFDQNLLVPTRSQESLGGRVVAQVQQDDP